MKMLFVSLDDVLRAIGACTEVPDWAKLAEQDDSALLQKINETNFRYSDAAARLDHHLMTTDRALLPRWFDTKDATGYPRPSDAARDDGMAFLLEQGKWYPQWLKFNKEFRQRSLPTIGRWASPPPTVRDYSRECPLSPASSEQYANRVREIVFEVVDIIAFLDRSYISHGLTQPQCEQALSASETNDERGDIRSDGPVSAGSGDPALSGDTVPLAEPRANMHREGRITSKSGRKARIDKAIRRAIELAGSNGDEVEAVFDQLIRLATECPEKFPPLMGYENGQVLYGDDGRRRAYTRQALAELLKRRRQRAVEST